MAILDIFKRKKIKRKKEEKVKKPSKIKVEEKKEVIESIVAPKKKIIGAAYGILQSPHITEKATDLAERNKYVFKVFKKTNKIEIKKAIENNYGVNVVGINIINIKRKKRKLGRQEGWRKGYKKAIVKIKEGQKIEVLPR